MHTYNRVACLFFSVNNLNLLALTFGEKEVLSRFFLAWYLFFMESMLFGQLSPYFYVLLQISRKGYGTISAAGGRGWGGGGGGRISLDCYSVQEDVIVTVHGLCSSGFCIFSSRIG